MILVDVDGVMVDIRKILREMENFPSAAAVAVSVGGSSGVSANFRSAVTDAAEGMGRSTKHVVELLNTTQETIRQAVMELAELDASVADETNTILGDFASDLCPPLIEETA